MELEQIIDDCLSPISEENPAGEDCKDMDIYCPFQEEISNIFSSSGKEKNWDKLKEEAIALLSKTSKDIEIALYLAISLYMIKGYSGYLAGLRIFVGIIKRFPGLYFPMSKNEDKTAKKRINIIYAFDKLSFQYLTPDSAKKTDTQYVHDIWDQLKELQSLIENISVPPPTINEILNRIGEFKSKYPMEPPENSTSDDATKTHIQSKETVQEDNSLHNNIAKQQKKNKPEKKQLNKSIDFNETNNFEKNLVKLSNIMRQDNSKDPIPYRMKRMALWDSKKELPPVKDGNIVLPFSNEMDKLKDRWLKPDTLTSEMLEELEKQFDNMLWWLDLQYAIVQTMNQLGKKYKEAMQAVILEIKYFLKRFPELPTLNFKNGKALASSDTRLWLDSLTAEIDSTYEYPSYLIDENLTDDIIEAESLAEDGKIYQALSLIQEGIKRSEYVGVKDIFCRKMAAARFCLNYKKAREAQIIFEHLFQLSKTYHLSQWDPQLYLELCQSYNKAIRQNSKLVSEDRKNEIASEILKLDIRINL